jgi:hypothetical protein
MKSIGIGLLVISVILLLKAVLSRVTMGGIVDAIGIVSVTMVVAYFAGEWFRKNFM